MTVRGLIQLLLNLDLSAKVRVDISEIFKEFGWSVFDSSDNEVSLNTLQIPADYCNFLAIKKTGDKSE